MSSVLRKTVMQLSKSNLRRSPLLLRNVCALRFNSSKTNWNGKSRNHEWSSNHSNSRRFFVPGTVMASAFASTWFTKAKEKSNDKTHDKTRVIPLSEVKKHCTEESLWVTFDGNVFDITSFVNGHPGLKSRLLMAGGEDLKPFWAIYQDHYRGHVIPWLQRFKIGTLTPKDREKQENSFVFWNAYDDDPVRHPDLLANTYHPFNGECVLERLTEKYYTPNHLHYVRNHLPVPRITSDEYELEVHSGNGIQKSKTYTLEDLKTKFKKYEVVSTLQCAGNRREDFHGLPRLNPKAQPDEPDTNLIYIGPHWVVGAISCTKWAGCRLRDVLEDCGLDVDSIALNKVNYGPNSDSGIGAHIHFTGADCDETGLEYGVSIPLDKAVDALGDCILAYEMGGKPLPRDHGYPVRALVPGFAGARNCKWLTEISLEPKTSMKPWHENAYRGFSPDISFEEDLYKWNDSDKVHLRPEHGLQDELPSMGEIALEQPIQSMVCNPPPNATIGGKGGLTELNVKGLAWSGGGRNVHRVDVSIDGGKSFVGANLFKPKDLRQKEKRMCQWGWYHFNATVPIPEDIQFKLKNGQKHDFEILSKAVSGDFNVQPSSAEQVYNARGIQINHYYRVPVTVDGQIKKNKLIRNHKQDEIDKFRNKPTGGKFLVPWEPLNGDMDHPVINKSEKENKFDKYVYDWQHAV